MKRYRVLFLHLRLNWQLMLMPIFLWGFFLSGGEVGFDFWLGLFVFHVMFYGGSVAFNSYYDQDEGPIGGLWDPPVPTRELLVFSLLIQIVGLGLIPLINLPILVLALVMFVLSSAYSHPAIRLKSRPWASLLTVSLGQGVGGAMAGWLCGMDDWTTLLSTRGLLGLLTSALFTTGFYPLTQLYQREEDLRRGDITFAVRWGERTFAFAIACMLAAAVGGALVLWDFASPTEAILAAGGLVVLAGAVYGWWQSFDGGQMRQNYKRMMGLGYLMSMTSLVYMAWQILTPSAAAQVKTPAPITPEAFDAHVVFAYGPGRPSTDPYVYPNPFELFAIPQLVVYENGLTLFSCRGETWPGICQNTVTVERVTRLLDDLTDVGFFDTTFRGYSSQAVRLGPSTPYTAVAQAPKTADKSEMSWTTACYEYEGDWAEAPQPLGSVLTLVTNFREEVDLGEQLYQPKYVALWIRLFDECPDWYHRRWCSDPNSIPVWPFEFSPRIQIDKSCSQVEIPQTVSDIKAVIPDFDEGPVFLRAFRDKGDFVIVEIRPYLPGEKIQTRCTSEYWNRHPTYNTLPFYEEN